jgi:membrane-bound metal-dependent hydrolase YbcI (DUF457 family)
MALPIAHATVGYLMHRADPRDAGFRGWPRALAYMAIANRPDADFLIGFVAGQPGRFHRGVSHTLVAAVVFGLLAAAFTRWRWRDRFLPAALMVAAVYASHLAVDGLTLDRRGPAGGQFLWPLSDAHIISPVTFFTEILIDGASRTGFLGTVLAWQTVPVLAREIVFASVLLLAVYAFTAWRAVAPEVDALRDGEEDLA